MTTNSDLIVYKELHGCPAEVLASYLLSVTAGGKHSSNSDSGNTVTVQRNDHAFSILTYLINIYSIILCIILVLNSFQY